MFNVTRYGLLAATALAGWAYLPAPAPAQQLLGETLNSYGMPGAIDTPTAQTLPDGTMGASISYSDYARRNTLVFQALPRLTAALRYTKMDGVDKRIGYLWDRSLDLQYQILSERDGWQPAVAVGLRDFMGTGVYSSEYVVASKAVGDKLRVSAGIGWGRLAGDWRRTDYEDEGGKPKYDEWFTGDAKPFGSIIYQASDRLSLAAEYGNDDYELESENGKDAPSRQFNLSADYRLGDAYRVKAYTVGGDVWGAQFTVALSPRQSPFPSGLEKAPAPVRPRAAPANDPEGWSGAWSADPTAQPAIQTALADALDGEGIELQAMALSANRAEIRIRNARYGQQPEAIGRAARMMTRALPASVETLVITSVTNGMPSSSVTLARSDVERLENTASALIAQRATITDAPGRAEGMVATDGLYPRFTWGLRPYFETGLFDPDEPFRYETGAALSARYELRPGLVVAGRVQQRVFGNKDQKGPGSYTPEEYEALDTDIGRYGVPRVRSDSRMYSGNSSPVVPELTLSWYARPTPTTYSRVSAGLLERGYGGISSEVLWKPVNSRLALGAELNHVRKRDFRDVFGFRDYEVTTGHVSAYYDFGGGIWGQVDAGKYLAGDVGATVTINREFANGWRVGAFATKTDLSDQEFGEGSFDKGIILEVPFSWALGQPTRRTASSTLRSLSRDGGSRLNVDGRLYEAVRDTHSGQLYESWGRFWR